MTHFAEKLKRFVRMEKMEENHLQNFQLWEFNLISSANVLLNETIQFSDFTVKFTKLRQSVGARKL